MPFILGFTAAHAALSYWLLTAVFSMTMRRLDTLQAVSWWERVVEAISTVLLWPVFYPLAMWGPVRWFTGWWGYAPLAVNSFVWAVAVLGVWKRCRSRRSGGAGSDLKS